VREGDRAQEGRLPGSAPDEEVRGPARVRGSAPCDWIVSASLCGVVLTTWAWLPPEPGRRIVCGPGMKARADVAELAILVSTFRRRHGRLPESLDDLLEPGLLERERVPLDPWGREYRLERCSAAPGFHVVSPGADGRTGGGGEASDIDSLELLLSR